MRSSPALLLWMAIGLALRLPWVVDRPLWLDEALQYQILAAEDLPGVLTASIAQDLHPPAFSLLSYGVVRWIDGELGLRLLPLLAGVAAIPAGMWAGRSWFGPREGLALAALVATCPPWVAWSREGRPYALAMLTLLLWLGVLGKLRRDPGHTRGWLLAAPLAMLWHYGSWLVVPVSLVPFLVHRPTRRPAGWALGLCAVVMMVHLPVFSAQFALRGDSPHLQEWTAAGAWLGLPAALGWLLTGSSGPSSVILGVVGILAGIGLAARGVRLDDLGSSPRLEWVLGLPALMLWIAAWMGHYPFGPVRHLLILAPGLLLLLARLSRGPRGAVGVGILAVGMGCLSLGRGPGLPVEDLPSLLEALEPQRGEAPIWVHPRLGPAARYYGLKPPFEVGSWHDPTPPEHGWRLLPEDLPSRGTLTLHAQGVHATWSPAPGEPAE